MNEEEAKPTLSPAEKQDRATKARVIATHANTTASELIASYSEEELDLFMNSLSLQLRMILR